MKSQEKESSTYRNGSRQRIYFPNNESYEGTWKDDLMDGQGNYQYKNGSVYEGGFEKGKRHGKGSYFVSTRKNSLVSNHGSADTSQRRQSLKETPPLKNVYTGYWMNDQYHGIGCLYMEDGSRYEGDFREGQRNGVGRLYFKNGDMYDGEWRNDKRYGEGSLKLLNGDIYDGEWVNDEKHGRGKYFYSQKDIVCYGEWDHNVLKCGEMMGLHERSEKVFPKLYLADPASIIETARRNSHATSVKKGGDHAIAHTIAMRTIGSYRPMTQPVESWRRWDINGVSTVSLSTVEQRQQRIDAIRRKPLKLDSFHLTKPTEELTSPTSSSTSENSAVTAASSHSTEEGVIHRGVGQGDARKPQKNFDDLKVVDAAGDGEDDYELFGHQIGSENGEGDVRKLATFRGFRPCGEPDIWGSSPTTGECLAS